MRRFSSEKLVELLNDPGFNQSAIAELAGVTSQCLFKLRDSFILNGNTLVSLVDALQKKLDYFFVEVEKKKPS